MHMLLDMSAIGPVFSGDWNEAEEIARRPVGAPISGKQLPLDVCQSLAVAAKLSEGPLSMTRSTTR